LDFNKGEDDTDGEEVGIIGVRGEGDEARVFGIFRAEELNIIDIEKEGVGGGFREVDKIFGGVIKVGEDGFIFEEVKDEGVIGYIFPGINIFNIGEVVRIE
jgi:hypothetical protein